MYATFCPVLTLQQRDLTYPNITIRIIFQAIIVSNADSTSSFEFQTKYLREFKPKFKKYLTPLITGPGGQM
jgi:hypothetical protein